MHYDNLSWQCYMQIELNSCFETIRELKKTISSSVPFSQKSLQKYEYVKFYTGLPNFKLLKSLFFDFVSPPACSKGNATKLTSFQEFMIVLSKLRFDSPLQDFAYKFNITTLRNFYLRTPDSHSPFLSLPHNP